MRKLRPSSYAGNQRFSPLSLIAVAVTLLVVVGAGTYFIILPKMSSHAAAADQNMNCTLIVPSDPLSATGLATPYQLVATNPDNGPCNETNANQSAFVQGVIYNRTTSQFSVYNPLVIDKGTRPAIKPTIPTLPQNSVVGIWFGFNATNLTLKARSYGTLEQANCVNGLGKSVFGQFADCNASAFFAAANQDIAAGKVKIPPLATANDGLQCPTVRDFSIVDQDQSDNVQTQYLSTEDGRLAQFSAANAAQLQNTTTVSNPSDNALLTAFINPALGCQSWQAPNLADNNAPVSALALDELQAAANQKAPVALVPLNDPMTLVNDNYSLTKTNLYRNGVDQTAATYNQQASGATYCKNLLQTGLPRLELDKPFTITATSPNQGTANSLFTFLAQRFQASWKNLNCTNLIRIHNPVAVKKDGNGIVIAARFNNDNIPPVAPIPTTVSSTPTPVPTTVSSTPTPVPTTVSSTPTPVPTSTSTGKPVNCSVNGQLINGCTGTTTINNEPCTFSVQYNIINVDCANK